MKFSTRGSPTSSGRAADRGGNRGQSQSSGHAAGRREEPGAGLDAWVNACALLTRHTTVDGTRALLHECYTLRESKDEETSSMDFVLCFGLA